MFLNFISPILIMILLIFSTILEISEKKKKLEPTRAVEKYVQYINNHVYEN